MKIQFILMTTTEVSHFAPVIAALRELGQDAGFAIPRMIIEGQTPFGWSDLGSLKQAVSNLWPKVPCEAVDFECEAVVTTQAGEGFERFSRAGIFRMQYGVGLVDPKTEHPMGQAADFYLVHGELGRRVQFSAHGIPGPLLPDERVKVIGYPRLDGWWTLVERSSRVPYAATKPTLLWLPTWSTRSSIDSYLDAISHLSAKFHIIVKPHHCTARWEPRRIRRLDGTSIELFPSTADTPDLMWYADIILADLSSGAYVEALHIGKPVVGLGTQEDIEHLIRQPSGAVVCVDPAMLPDSIALAMGVDWKNDPLIKELRADLITSTYGHDGEVAARAIMECLR